MKLQGADMCRGIFMYMSFRSCAAYHDELNIFILSRWDYLTVSRHMSGCVHESWGLNPTYL